MPLLVLVDDDDVRRVRLVDDLLGHGFDLIAPCVSRPARGALEHADALLLAADARNARELHAAAVIGDCTLPALPVLTYGPVAAVDSLRRIGRPALELREPFELEDLRRCADALTGRDGDPGALSHGPITLNVLERTVTLDGTPVDVTARELRLLATLLAQPDRTHTKAELAQHITGSASAVYTLDSTAMRLSLKLEAAGGPRLHNVWGVGLRAPLLDQARS